MEAPFLDAVLLRPFERRLLDTFFAEGSPVRLSRLGDWSRRTIPAIQAALHEEVAREGFFTANPETIRQRYRRLGTTIDDPPWASSV